MQISIIFCVVLALIKLELLCLCFRYYENALQTNVSLAVEMIHSEGDSFFAASV